MPEQCLTRYKHKQIFIKQGLFCARCQRRDFLEQSSLGILTSPVPFPSITIIKPPKKAGHVLLKVVSFHPLRPPWLSLQHWWLGCSLRLREQAGSQQRSCQGSAPSQPIPALLQHLGDIPQGLGNQGHPSESSKCPARQQRGWAGFPPRKGRRFLPREHKGEGLGGFRWLFCAVEGVSD